MLRTDYDEKVMMLLDAIGLKPYPPDLGHPVAENRNAFNPLEHTDFFECKQFIRGFSVKVSPFLENIRQRK